MSFLIGLDFTAWGANDNYLKATTCLDSVTANSGTFIYGAFEMMDGRVRDSIHLGNGARRILNTPNAGGNSIWSEALSFELLEFFLGARLLKTEMELEYFPEGSKITDFSVSLYNKKIGVSVTRAMKYKGTFEEIDAETLLNKKLKGVNESSINILEQHAWEKQILFVWVAEDYIIRVLKTVYDRLTPELKSTTLVVAFSSKNAPWLYMN